MVWLGARWNGCCLVTGWRADADPRSYGEGTRLKSKQKGWVPCVCLGALGALAIGWFCMVPLDLFLAYVVSRGRSEESLWFLDVLLMPYLWMSAGVLLVIALTGVLARCLMLTGKSTVSSAVRPAVIPPGQVLKSGALIGGIISLMNVFTVLYLVYACRQIRGAMDGFLILTLGVLLAVESLLLTIGEIGIAFLMQVVRRRDRLSQHAVVQGHRVSPQATSESPAPRALCVVAGQQTVGHC